MGFNLFGSAKKSFDELYNEGREYFRNKDYKKALQYYEKAYELQPDNPDILNSLGAAHSWLDNDQQALTYFLKAVKISPNDAVISNNTGNIYYALSDYHNAIIFFRKAAQLDPKEVTYINNLGKAFHSLGNYDEAYTSYKKAYDLSNKDVTYLNNMKKVEPFCKNLSNPVSVKKSSVDNDIDPKAVKYYELGDKSFDEKDYEQAVEYYKKAIEIEPAYPIAFNNLAAAYAWLDNDEEGIKYQLKAIKLKPESASYHYSLGLMYHRLDDFENARKYIKKAIELDPKNKKYKDKLDEVIQEQNDLEEEELDSPYPGIDNKAVEYFEKANGLMNDEKYKEAISFYQKALKIEPDFTDALINIGNTYTWLDDWEKSVEFYEKALEINPDNSDEIHKLIANSYFNIDDLDNALEHYIEYSSSNPDDYETIKLIGDIYSSKEEHEEALGYYENAINSQPEIIDYIINAADEEMKLKRHDEAIKRLDEALRIKKEQDIIYNFMGVVYHDNGQTDKAEQYYNKAYKINPENPQVNFNLAVIKNDSGDKESALKFAKMAVRLNPESETYQEFLEEIESGEGEKYSSGNQTQDKPVKKITPPENIQIDQVLAELDSLTGMDNIKEDIRVLIKYIRVEEERKKAGMSSNELTLHTVFYGPPGTGKTTVARLMGKIFKSMGLLSKGHVIEVQRADLVGEAWGETGKITNKVIDSALDGVLFIDEAYTLKQKEDDVFGQDAIDCLLKRMEDDRSRLIVITAGYYEEMQEFINSNPGLKSRFTRYFTFKDYTPDQLLTLFNKAGKEFKLTDEAEDKLKRYFKFKYDSRDKTFANGRLARELFSKVLQLQSSRVDSVDKSKLSDSEKKAVLATITLEDIEKAVKSDFIDTKSESLEDILKNLDSFVGMTNVKKELESLVKFIKFEKIKEAKGMTTSKLPMHTVFCGPPGTGKTTIARTLGKIFRHLGISAQGHVVEVTRADFVGKHLGDTEDKTEKIIAKAMGGILFIDEAYTLVKADSGNDFGIEAINLLLKRMEDHRDKLIVIAAGYKNEMNTFIESNPGLKSRFTRYFYFEDYTPDELFRIFVSICNSKEFTHPYMIMPDAADKLKEYFTGKYDKKDENFGNGRFVRNVFQKVIEVIPNRFMDLTDFSNISEEELQTIKLEDVEYVIKNHDSSLN